MLTLLKINKQTETGFQLDDINFSQKRFQNLAIAGETGAGKSTLLKIIAGLIQPDEGTIRFEDETVTGPDENLVPGHPGISYLSQHFELPKSLRVEQILAYANTMSDEEANALFQVSRVEHLLRRRTDQLSGGEKQRIALAKLLISSPRLLLLDEPFSNLDRIHKNILQSVIHRINKRLKITCIIISHDPTDLLGWADKILVMKDGRIIQQGSPEEIYNKPVDIYTANLFGKTNILGGTKAKAIGIATNLAARKKLLIRPENLKIVKKNINTLEGKVRKVSFCGSHYEVEVLISKTRILVKTDVASIAKDDTLFLTISPKEVWCFD